MISKSSTRTTTSILFLFVATIMVLPLAAEAAQTSALQGEWEGHVEFTNVQPEIQLKFDMTEKGTLTAKMNLPNQDATGLPIENIDIDGNAVSFELVNNNTRALFKGTLSEDDGSISGEFIQAGHSYPFLLNSTGKGSVKMTNK